MRTETIHIDIRRGDRKQPLALHPTEVLRLPWNPATILAFEAHHDALVDIDPAEVISTTYHLGIFRGHVSGVVRSVPAPSLLAYTAEKLLENVTLREVGRFFTHPTGILPAHNNVWQVPYGGLGGGMVIVRDSTVLAYGRRNNIPTERLDREKLIRQTALRLMEELGYVRRHDPDAGDP